MMRGKTQNVSCACNGALRPTPSRAAQDSGRRMYLAVAPGGSSNVGNRTCCREVCRTVTTMLCHDVPRLRYRLSHPLHDSRAVA